MTYRQEVVIADVGVPRAALQLKRIALLFDQLVVLTTEHSEWDPYTKAVRATGELLGAETDWLVENSIVRFQSDAALDELAAADSSCAEDRRSANAAICQMILCNGNEPYFEPIVRDGATAIARSAAVVMRTTQENRVVPLIFEASNKRAASTSHELGELQEQSAAVKAIFNRLPTPDEDTPWEAILDFRSDPQVKRAFTALRTWISKMNTSELSPRDLQEQLEYDLQVYEDHLRYHRLKYRYDRFESLITAPIGFVENLVKLKWSGAAKALFSVGRCELDRMKSELSLPNKELHYLVAVEEKFRASSEGKFSIGDGN